MIEIYEKIDNPSSFPKKGWIFPCYICRSYTLNTIQRKHYNIYLCSCCCNKIKKDNNINTAFLNKLKKNNIKIN